MRECVHDDRERVERGPDRAGRPSGRRVTPERMDDPNLPRLEHDRALTGLARLNRLSGSAGIVWRAIADLLPSSPPPLRLLDVATGGGDVVVALARRAERRRKTLAVTGCDVSAVALAHAARRLQSAGVHGSVRLVRADAIRDELPAGHDVVVTSLFLHHLDDATIITVLRRLAAAARRRVVVNDLERGWLNRVLVGLAGRLVTRSPVVHEDGPRSVRAAFTRAELLDLARRAGLDDAVVRRVRPCRLLLTWDRR